MVRVTVSDGREYLGRLQCVDQTKAVFVQDALELVDRESEHYLEHQLLTPELLKRCPDNQRFIFKMVGNIVVPGKHVVKIQLDKRF